MSGMTRDKKNISAQISVGDGRQDINNQSSHDDYIMAERAVIPAGQK